MPPHRNLRRILKKCSCRRCLADPWAVQLTAKTIRQHLLRQRQDDLRKTWRKHASGTLAIFNEDVRVPRAVSESYGGAYTGHNSPVLDPGAMTETEAHDGWLDNLENLESLSGNIPELEEPYGSLNSLSRSRSASTELCGDPYDEVLFDGGFESDSGSSAGSGSESCSNAEGFSLVDDPLYVPAEDLCLSDCENAETSSYWKEPPAFSEHPFLRKAYIDAFILGTFYGGTQEAVKHQLTSAYEDYVLFVETSGVPIPGLENMARTLRTAERCLGIDPDELIVYYYLCNVCFGRHHPSTIPHLDSPSCTKLDCGGALYTTKVLANVLQRYFLRPGKYAQLNAWRGAQDQPGQCEPSETIRRPELGDFDDPEARISDVFDALGWRMIQAGLERRRSGRWGVEDVDVNQIHQRFVSLPCGLVFQIFIDWFCPLQKSRSHSSGAVYVTIVNNPRGIRFSREDTFLYCLIPGPHEPSFEQINELLKPFVDDMLELGNGMHFDVWEQDDPALVHGSLWIQISDLPASRKVTGLRGVTAERWMCTECYATVSSLVSPDCFNPSKFQYRDDNRFLKYAYLSRDADAEQREEIAELRGVRWSVLDEIPGFNPAVNSPVDFMHAAYLGEAKHVLQGILLGNAMFQARNSSDKPSERFQEFFDSIWYPSSVGRLPKKLLSTAKLKADQLRYMTALLPVALYLAWGIDGEIPDTDAPLPRKGTKAYKKWLACQKLLKQRRVNYVLEDPNNSPEELERAKNIQTVRNYAQHYEAIINWCVSLRIMGSQSYTPWEIVRAERLHADACQAWARMGCHLTPNFHLLCHEPRLILRVGPVYGWWGFPYERHNGFLGGMKNNGHIGGEMEATMMRGWLKHQLIFDLILRLKTMETPSQQDEYSLAKLQGLIKGEMAPGTTRQRGTLLNLLAQLRSLDQNEMIVLPTRRRVINLHRFSPVHYDLLLAYLQIHWQERAVIVPYTAPSEDGEPLIATAVEAFSHITVRGIRFGASSNHQGRNLCCIVQRFVCDDDLPMMPWVHRGIDLGIGTWYAETFDPPEVIDAARLCGQFALATLPALDARGALWITISLCHTEEEPDILNSTDIPNLEQP
ncbi:hypothetical protein BN946_scf184624.g1 [Trametes cinnabarina]|uniref:Uncharacterized protein n=1 Tax=Pycnoporus cinnabarinus TaxID=5643 RepID=A0A060STP0_PYCCI|nr:hypothetical protein BN946_scf184624.g1 [Trametes cinnabarina]